MNRFLLESDQQESLVWAVDLVVIPSLQRRIPFYFAAIFHIGRQWKISESAVRDPERAVQGENLTVTTRLTLDNLRKRDDGPAMQRQEGDVTRALSVLLQLAGKEHSNRLREAQRWWSALQEEVRQLRSQTDRLQEVGRGEPNYRLWPEAGRFVLEGYRPSALYYGE